MLSFFPCIIFHTEMVTLSYLSLFLYPNLAIIQRECFKQDVNISSAKTSVLFSANGVIKITASLILYVQMFPSLRIVLCVVCLTNASCQTCHEKHLANLTNDFFSF